MTEIQFRTNVDHGQIISLVRRIVCQINPNERLYLIISVLNLHMVIVDITEPSRRSIQYLTNNNRIKHYVQTAYRY